MRKFYYTFNEKELSFVEKGVSLAIQEKFQWLYEIVCLFFEVQLNR